MSCSRTSYIKDIPNELPDGTTNTHPELYVPHERQVVRSGCIVVKRQLSEDLVPDQVINFTGLDFHKPTSNVSDYLKQNGNITSKEEIDKILASKKVDKILASKKVDKILASKKVEKVKAKSPFSKNDLMATFDISEKETKAILRKDKCLAAIGERPAEVTDDSKWDEMDGNAIANLHLALADGVLSSIKEKKSAKEIWDHIAQLYEARSLHNKNFLKRKLYALRMTESTSVTEHVNNLNTLFSQLTYLSFFDDVAVAILEKENRRNNKEGRETSSRQVEALVVTRGWSMEPGSSGSHNHDKSKTGKKKNFKCFKYGKPGHFRKDCRGLNTSYPQGNVSSTLEDGNALCCEATVANESRKIFADVWLFDTGATFHMTARREWFHQYKPISRGGSVYRCNDHELISLELEVSW
ncbi:gag-pol polyprotein [Tanacetum coccineum]